MKYIKLLCHIALFISNRYVIFYGMFGINYLMGRLLLPITIFEIYSILLFLLFPLFFYVFELTIFLDFVQHRHFFMELLKQLKKKE
jgi:hypothetical protein